MADHHQNKFMGYPPGLSLGQPWFMNQPSMADVGFESVDSGAVGVGEDELDSKSGGSDNAEGAACGSGEDHESGERPRKKRYYRHTQHKIQEMEMSFKEFPHPDDKQRKEVSREAGLDSLQTQLERMENSQLKAENEKLMAENMRYKEALSHASCFNCGGPARGKISFDEHQLLLENARLRQEIDRISGIVAKHVGKPLMNSLPSGISRSGRLDLGMDVGRGCSEMFGVNGANVSTYAGIAERCLALGFAPTEICPNKDGETSGDEACSCSNGRIH